MATHCLKLIPIPLRRPSLRHTDVDQLTQIVVSIDRFNRSKGHQTEIKAIQSMGTFPRHIHPYTEPFEMDVTNRGRVTLMNELWTFAYDQDYLIDLFDDFNATTDDRPEQIRSQFVQLLKDYYRDTDSWVVFEATLHTIEPELLNDSARQLFAMMSIFTMFQVEDYSATCLYLGIVRNQLVKQLIKDQVE